MFALFLKSLLGALAVLLIALLSRSKSFFIVGLWSLLPYGVYLLVVAWLSLRCSLGLTLASATAAWLGSAGLLLLAWSRLFPQGN